MTEKKQSFLVESTKYKQYYGTGYRKTSCARVFLRKIDHCKEEDVFGPSNVCVNNHTITEYFKQRNSSFIDFFGVFKCVEVDANFLVKIFVSGGGVSSQISAIRYGVAKALLSYGSTLETTRYVSMKKILKDLGFVTRDSRVVERKKYGLRKARKRKQYSKR